MAKMDTNSIPQGFAKPDDWYLVTLWKVELVWSKTHKPMVVVEMSIEDALTPLGQGCIGQTHREWFVVAKEASPEDVLDVSSVDWDPTSIAAQQLVRMWRCVPHTEGLEDMLQLLGELEKQTLFVQLKARDDNSQSRAFKSVEDAPEGYKASENNLMDITSNI